LISKLKNHANGKTRKIGVRKIGVSPGIHEFVLTTCPTTGFLYNLKKALDPIFITPTP
jgi:hypothetical protein